MRCEKHVPATRIMESPPVTGLQAPPGRASTGHSAGHMTDMTTALPAPQSQHAVTEQARCPATVISSASRAAHDAAAVIAGIPAVASSGTSRFHPAHCLVPSGSWPRFVCSVHERALCRAHPRRRAGRRSSVRAAISPARTIPPGRPGRPCFPVSTCSGQGYSRLALEQCERRSLRVDEHREAAGARDVSRSGDHAWRPGRSPS